ncbi:MAG: hypothetical protein JRI54_07475, partial [Deltaproteobacteria bacterium]|nr:hypothetical protein [Deltaproteobacteria bacterium]
MLKKADTLSKAVRITATEIRKYKQVSKKAEYTAKPFPKDRRLVVDAGFIAHRKHVTYALMEVDVTKPRQFFREHKANTKHMHAYRNWRGRLILFDEVDVHTPIETESGRVTLPYIIRGANNKAFYDIHSEIRAIQANPESDPISGKIEWLVRLPGFIRRGLYWIFTKNPQW